MISAVRVLMRYDQWLVAGSHGVEMYLRLVLFSALAFVVVCAVPIVGK